MKIFRVFVKLYTSYNCEERMKRTYFSYSLAYSYSVIEYIKEKKKKSNTKIIIHLPGNPISQFSAARSVAILPA